jgi:adenine phosphoribosyltransferase
MAKKSLDLTPFIRDVPDWPKKGILFRDITPLLANAEALQVAVKAMCVPYEKMGIDFVAAVEARGFIFGTAVAERLVAGFVPIRKKGKLPCKTECVSYGLEYGTDTIEMHQDTIPAGAKVLMVDDLLATGGTMKAACQLVEKTGAQVVAVTCLIELTALKGRERLSPYPVHTVIAY